MKKIFSILALLLMAVSGAWAQAPQTSTLLTTIKNDGDNSSFKSGSKTFDGIATVTLNGNISNDGDSWGWYTGHDPCTIAVTAVGGYTITSCKFYTDNGSAEDTQSPFEATVKYGDDYSTWVNGNKIGRYGVVKIEVYGYATPATVDVTGVTLSQTSADMTVGGDALMLTATVAPATATDQTVTWTTSDANVATVADGVVTAVAAGTATITATATNGTADTSDDKTATCAVTVAAPATVDVTGVTLSQTSADMTVGGDALMLTATVAPATATDQTVTWTTSDANVATVADGVVTAVAAGTATITAIATNGTADTSDDKTATCEVTVAAPATKYDLTKADGSEAHGTVAFTVGGNAATQAKKDDVVTVSVTPAEGYSAKDVTVRAYTSWEAAYARRRSAPALVSDITVTKQENGTWTFTMPEANVWVVVTYTKNLQDAWIQTIADQTYTGSAIEPTIEVKDGETTLVLNTDYTVAYSNNVNTGTATVTVTGTGNYSGTATANFTIVADKSALNTAITEAETYYNSIKDDHVEAAAALKTAIDNAKAMQEKGDATQEEVNNALSALTTAKTTAEGAVLTETKNELNDDITAAETYYNSIKDGHTTAANTLKEAIDAAKGVKDNAGATQEQVDAAIAALAGAKTTAEQTVLTETKTALNDDITDAEVYYNSIKDSNPTAAATLLEAINAAKAVKNNADATQEQVDAAIAALTGAKTTAEQTVLTETKTALNDDITDAEAYYNSIKDSNPTAAATLLDAINAAKTVKDNADATQEQVDAAIAALASAKTTAEQTVLTETKTALNDDITEAEAYYNSIKDSNPEAAATLLDAINAAKAAKDNGEATQADVEAAIAALSTASNTAKVEVSRITLTIPAKSYMARIDADKRQIETAVAGVKLYSVKSVTNTEVELTGELSVIAAEMPYFIYNDNDTEVEVSIVVSSEEADNVDYDSEHFKGTLVDKTFTDEDMQEADHYVLSGGSSFVWVKDAGVLSAGKCWIELIPSSAAHARRLSIVHEGETTGISTVKTTVDTKDAAVYDLQGRRVMQPTKGLFIVNGKKVVIK